MLSGMNSAPLNVIGYLSLVVTPFMVAALGYLINRALTHLDADLQEAKQGDKRQIEKINVLTQAINSVTVEFNSFKRDLETALIAARQVDILKEKIAIHERNEHTMWKHIDEIKLDIKQVEDSIQGFGTLISEFRRSYEHIREKKDGTG